MSEVIYQPAPHPSTWEKHTDIPESTRLIQNSVNQLASTTQKDIGFDVSQKKSFNLASLKKLSETYGVFSSNEMRAAGLQYTGSGDTACCDVCGFEHSGWNIAEKPFTIHARERPDCQYVIELKSNSLIITRSSNKSTMVSTTSNFVPNSTVSSASVRSASISHDHETPSKRQKLETNDETSPLDLLYEVKSIERARRRTFSHWPHRTTPSKAQMIEAGFFACNVGDRVMCIYCNLICQQWSPNIDDPSEVHKTLSPKCVFVKSKLIRREMGSIMIVNDNLTNVAGDHRGPAANNPSTFATSTLVHTVACHPTFTEIPRRMASYSNWSAENLPSVDDLVRAGFFYAGTKTIVTCFYCNGSLQNWGPKDNPMIEHARWFPQCAYAKQLCGDDLYRKIQESKRAQQERAKANEARERNGANATPNSTNAANSRQLLIPDESTLSRLVAARLDLPISQSLLNEKFKVSIIKRCWEDQLRLKHDDFESDCDLRVACMILQKQIEHIDGKKENIIVPSIKMKQLREELQRARTAATATAQDSTAATASTDNTNLPTATTSTPSALQTNDTDSSMETNSQASTNENQQTDKATKSTATPEQKKPAIEATPTNPCLICMQEEKGLACIPCGHLATCVPCGHSLRSCPICRREIEAFVRVYM